MAGIDLGDAWADEVWESGVWSDGTWAGQEAVGAVGSTFGLSTLNNILELTNIYGGAVVLAFLLLGA